MYFKNKNADIYCAFTEVKILNSDDTIKEFKTCYFLPSESIKSGKLDPSTENALSTTAYTQSDPTKILKEYEVEMIDSKGRKLKCNSVTGVEMTENNGKFIHFYKNWILAFLLVFIL